MAIPENIKTSMYLFVAMKEFFELNPKYKDEIFEIFKSRMEHLSSKKRVTKKELFDELSFFSLLYEDFNAEFLNYRLKGRDAKNEFRLSTGQISELQMYGSILKSLAINIAKGKRDFFIILDEIDITLHPSRQQTIIKRLKENLERIVEYFNKHFAQDNSKKSTEKSAVSEEYKPKFQVLLTSHSPYTVSDLEGNLSVFLTKNKNSPLNTPTVALKPNRFGGNLSKIMHDSFEIKNLQTGAHSAEIIEEIIRAVRQFLDIYKEDDKFFKQNIKKAAHIKCYMYWSDDNRIKLSKDKMNLSRKEYLAIQKDELKNMIEGIGEELIQARLLNVIDPIVIESTEKA